MYHSHMELSSVLPPEISLNPGANWISLRSNVAVSSLVLRIDCGRVKTGGPLAVSEILRKWRKLTVILVDQDGCHVFGYRFVFSRSRDERHALKRAVDACACVDAVKGWRSQYRQGQWDRLDNCVRGQHGRLYNKQDTHSGSRPCPHLSLRARRPRCFPAPSRPTRPGRRARDRASRCLCGCRRGAAVGLRRWRASEYGADSGRRACAIRGCLRAAVGGRGRGWRR